MLKRLALAGAAALSLAACVEEDRYPVSGTECHEDDPVLEMSVADCAPALPGGSGTF